MNDGSANPHRNDRKRPAPLGRAGAEGEREMIAGKVTWAQVGEVAEPGRYMFKFGWLTITAEDLVVWKQFPSAMFTLVPIEPSEDGEEYRLGSFDVGRQP
jgi:hypothetical protein